MLCIENSKSIPIGYFNNDEVRLVVIADAGILVLTQGLRLGKFGNDVCIRSTRWSMNLLTGSHMTDSWTAFL